MLNNSLEMLNIRGQTFPKPSGISSSIHTRTIFEICSKLTIKTIVASLTFTLRTVGTLCRSYTVLKILLTFSLNVVPVFLLLVLSSIC